MVESMGGGDSGYVKGTKNSNYNLKAKITIISLDFNKSMRVV